MDCDQSAMVQILLVLVQTCGKVPQVNIQCGLAKQNLVIALDVVAPHSTARGGLCEGKYSYRHAVLYLDEGWHLVQWIFIHSYWVPTPISYILKGLNKITTFPHSSFYGFINVTHIVIIAVGNLLVWSLWNKTDVCNDSLLRSCYYKFHHSGAKIENGCQGEDW